MIHPSTPFLLYVVQEKGIAEFCRVCFWWFFSDELSSQVSVFPILGGITSKLPWEGEGSLLPLNLAEHRLQGGINTLKIVTRVISTGQNSLHISTYLPILLNQDTFFLQGLCVLALTVLVFSPKIISRGKNTVFFIPAVFLVTVTISWQYVCILGQNQITCWKLLFPLPFLQHYSWASNIKTIIWKNTIDAILSFIQTCHHITCNSYLITFYQSIVACPFENQLLYLDDLFLNPDLVSVLLTVFVWSEQNPPIHLV